MQTHPSRSGRPVVVCGSRLVRASARFLVIALLFATGILTATCGGGPPSAPPPFVEDEPPGSVVFWTDATHGWSRIDISLEGSTIGSLTRHLDEPPQNCAPDGTGARVVAARPGGTYSYEARSDTGVTWGPTEVNIQAGGCLRFRIHCGDDRDCRPDPPECTIDSNGFNTCAVRAFSRLASQTGGAWYRARDASEMPDAILSAIDRAVATGGSSFDLMFIIDNTGSMSDDISAVKARVSQIIDRIRRRGDGTQRVGLALYSDLCVERNWLVFQDLTTDLDRIERQIRGITVSGGGDVPESVYDAVETVLRRATWRHPARYGLLIGDAPPHEEGDACHRATFEDAVSAARSTEVLINLFPIVSSLR